MKPPVFLAVLLLGCPAGALPQSPPPPPRAEVYLSDKPTAATGGTGTLADPYDVSSTDKFDARMRAIPTDTVIHLAAGNYTTRGCPTWSVKDGWTIHGAGMDQTIVKLADGGTWAVSVIGGAGSNDAKLVEVTDLTADANFHEQVIVVGAGDRSTPSLGGVNLLALRTRIERVKVLHTGGLSSETFSLSGVDYGEHPSFHIIRDCVVAEPGIHDYPGGSPAPSHGPGDSGIGIHGNYAGGIIEGCVVYGDGSSKVAAIAPACSLTGGLTVRNNTSYRCLIGLHFDTLTHRVPIQGLQIVGNHFYDCLAHGIHLNGTSHDNLPDGRVDPAPNTINQVRVEGNDVSITDAPDADCINSEGGLQRCIFRSNLLRRSAYSDGTSHGTAVRIGDAASGNNIIEDNRCDAGMLNFIPAKVASGRDNYDLAGASFFQGGGTGDTLARYGEGGGGTPAPSPAAAGKPTVAAGGGAGAGATVEAGAGSDDRGMQLILTTGAAPGAAGEVIATVAFGTPYPTACFAAISPANPNAAALGSVPITAGTPGGFSVQATTGLAAGKEYRWNVVVAGH